MFFLICRSHKPSTQITQRYHKPDIHTQTLLLILPEIRLSDNAMREFWLNVHHGMWNLESANNLNDKKDPDENNVKIPMKKLFIEMLEAGIEWFDEERDNADNQ